MKKFLIAIVACMFAAPSFAQFSSGGFSLDEEHLYWGVRLGVNFSGISGDIESDKGRTGFVLGSERGGKDLKSSKVDAFDPNLPDGHLNYLEIPVLIKYGVTAENNIAILPFIGPYLSLGVSGNYRYLKHPEVGLKVGCGVEWNNLYAEALYQFGLSNIADAKGEPSSHGHSLGINIGINF